MVSCPWAIVLSLQVHFRSPSLWFGQNNNCNMLLQLTGLQKKVSLWKRLLPSAGPPGSDHAAWTQPIKERLSRQVFCFIAIRIIPTLQLPRSALFDIFWQWSSSLSCLTSYGYFTPENFSPDTRSKVQEANWCHWHSPVRLPCQILPKSHVRFWCAVR